MNKFYTIVLLMVIPFFTWAQTTINPTITPVLFQHNTEITVVYDVTGTSLANLTDAWAWVWIPGANIDARYNHNPATTPDAPAKYVKSIAGGKTLFTLVFKPSDFFVQDISTQSSLGILLKASDWSGGQTTDYVANFGFTVTLNEPATKPIFVDNGEQLAIEAQTPVVSSFELFVNDVSVDTQAGITLYEYDHTVTETSGFADVKLVATSASGTAEVSFQYFISVNSPVEARPEGIISGINYTTDHTKVTLCLLAPGKTSVYVLGDFSDWNVLPENIMNRDGEYFWIEISGLTPGQEYAFQYLVGEKVFMADPYADKILDPDDQYIPASTYPDLKSFPSQALHSEWYFNRLAVFQTSQQEYDWQVEDFEKPAKEKLVVYELLIRDFFENGERNYQNLIDTINYFKRLGINAIELMPIMEFNGNESWGYNPAFMFAPDKYYGTKNKFKEFIDVCHGNGIAVILDIAMNHQDIPNPYVLMDFDFTTSKPTPENKWFNTDARHPFNVFYDMNHESLYTKQYLDTVNYHWLNEYKVDGFRFDLSKGFTQTNNPNNTEAWSAYDASRIAILKRMADKIWSYAPDAYVILEHLSANNEEKELAEYRSGEGKGMMLWGKMTDQYNQNTMGYTDNSDISAVLYTDPDRGWSVPHLVSYMESHDEERLMYKNVQYGNSTGSYNVKDLTTGLKRMLAANIIFYTVPGPKMLWQFGELGYDYSINRCEDGSINPTNCRVSPKPVRWDYQDEPARDVLFRHTAEIIKLRAMYSVFTEGTATIPSTTGLTKQIAIKNTPYTATPANTDQMNAQVVANFELTTQSIMVDFPHTGTWHEFYSGTTIQVNALPFVVSLPPGGYKLFTDVQIPPSVVTEVVTATEEEFAAKLIIYPNPVETILMIESENAPVQDLKIYTNQGVKFSLPRIAESSWDTSNLKQGLYIVEVKAGNRLVRKKIVKL